MIPLPRTDPIAAGNILVVDDEEGIREVCRRVLVDAGYQVTTAENGDEAMTRLKAQDFDFVLTDIMMPGEWSGAELLKAIKQKSPTTDVVMMTGFPTLETAIPTLKNGAYDYLAKPVDISLLLSVVGRCFEKRRLSEELNREKILRQELQAAYEELQKVEKMKEAFLSRMSHELRTPFVPVFFALEEIEHQAKENIQPMLQLLRNHISSLWEIVENMLLFTDLRQIDESMAKVSVDPKILLQEILDKYKGEAEKKGVSVTLTTEGVPGSLEGDKQLLSTAFKHLFLNAIYFNKTGGTVRIVLKNQQDHIDVIFTDSGVGIPADKLPNIFDNFYQAAEYMTREVGGLGLGLAIVRRILEVHGGSVAVTSCAGKGSEFAVLLPRKERRAHHA